MSRFKLAFGPLAVALMCLMSAPSAFAEYRLNMTPGVTPVSQDIYSLHMTIFFICVAIGVVVFGAMFYSMFKFRKSTGAQPAKFHHSTIVEVVWTLIPFAILVMMAIPATKVLIAMEDTADADLTIKITGSQWKWQYDYLGQDLTEEFSFISSLSTPRRFTLS